jgi:hypothetical protein
MIKGFSGDHFFKEAVQELVEQNGIKTIVETGTFKGDTTVGFAKMVDSVYTIEINPKYRDEAMVQLKEHDNIVSLLGNAPEVLDEIIPEVEHPSIFFLDAHWGANPLLGELATIAKHKIRPVIIIHDFKVPDHPELGFDTYPEQGIVYDWDYVKDAVEKIYGEDYIKAYNEEAAGSKRGILLLAP